MLTATVSNNAINGTKHSCDKHFCVKRHYCTVYWNVWTAISFKQHQTSNNASITDK